MKIFFMIIILFLVSIGLYSQDFKKHILFLASESLHGRYPATNDEKLAAEYIMKNLNASNCNVTYQKFQFEKDSAINVIGFLNQRKDSTVIISAHYDHLGYGNGKSLELNKKGIHPGADDNASGVAMMLELANDLRLAKQLKYNIVFAAWSAHESGLFGSEFFANSSMFNSLKICAVINFDMVGRLNKTKPVLKISGADSNLYFQKIFQGLATDSISFRMDNEDVYKSDLKHFAQKGISVLNFTTGLHNDYHRISDTEEKINYDGMSKVFNVLRKVINALGYTS